MVAALRAAAHPLLASAAGLRLHHAMSAESILRSSTLSSANFEDSELIEDSEPIFTPRPRRWNYPGGNARVHAGLSELSPQNIALLGAASNVVLSVLKLAVGLLAGSASLVADAGHSCSDLVVDGVCMLAVNAPVLERVCTAVIACVLASAGCACLWNGVTTLAASSFVRTQQAMGPWPFVVALIAIASKEALYRITSAAGEKRRSAILIASAKHHRSDAITSVAAAMGSGGVLLGFPAADALAAAMVGFIIIKMSVEIGMGAAAHG
uniref:Cation efflux protein transmembrane domain-containing protein n=1 Tax=Phaeocystis antarctica TaxID=33657 RepID=A0A7S0HXI8_9EUKA|mmetsp:Transcript_3827/g.8620  ORF Transcript_3827/g.8620 Transcript_3827/m.8620 type:complete len:267 (+) Transcript_3827:70-870(+)